MTSFTAQQAQQQFSQFEEMLFDKSEEIQIQFQKGNAVLLSSDDYENLLEHLYILQDPVVMKQIKSRNVLQTERYNSLSELQDALEN